MKTRLAVITLAIVLSAGALAAEPFGLRQQGNVLMLVSKLSSHPFPNWMMIPETPGPEKTGIMVWLKSYDPSTTGFKVTVKYRDADGNVGTASNIGSAVLPFWIGEVQVIGISVEELKSASKLDFDTEDSAQ